MDEFGVTNHMARMAKKLQNEEGALTYPKPKPGKVLSEEKIKLIEEFFSRDDISRQMPGKKDCISIRVNGEKKLLQKRLILFSLREAYALFKTSGANFTVSFSKFCTLRPRYVILPGAPGTHCTCVCTYHQNVSLMLENSGLSTSNIFETANGSICYKHFLAETMCNPPREQCWLNKCEECPGSQKVEEKIMDYFVSQDIDSVR